MAIFPAVARTISCLKTGETGLGIGDGAGDGVRDGVGEAGVTGADMVIRIGGVLQKRYASARWPQGRQTQPVRVVGTKTW